ncbi:hypothetical protein AGLY_004312 [Aphis glycines]|uniref:Uncharacterized protein n=1 Tax=Aphis glycines TaxID=307491 RepID=A0A6G0U063_APHGL|nr:hypothetical protein AGLY_004312 [Aphis glycines]
MKLYYDVTEPAGVAERPDAADAADAALEALLPGDGERDPAGDLEGLLDGDADRPEPDILLERDLDAAEAGDAGETGDIGDTGEAGEAGSDPDGELARAGEADFDDWLLLFADDELDTDSESLASGKSKPNTKQLIHTIIVIQATMGLINDYKYYTIYLTVITFVEVNHFVRFQELKKLVTTNYRGMVASNTRLINSFLFRNKQK